MPKPLHKRKVSQ